MSKHRTDILYGHAIPQDFLDAWQEYISTYLSPNFAVTVVNPTTLRVVAGVSNDQVCIGVNGKWRYNTANADAALPGGLPNGDHPVFVVASDNSFTGGTGGSNETDLTDYTFRLLVLAAGSTPSGTGTQALWRQVANVSIVSGAITDVRLVSATTTRLAKHASQHLAGAVDALTWTIVHGAGTLAARPTASASNAGYVYLAIDVNSGTLYRSDGSVWTKAAVGVSEISSPSNSASAQAILLFGTLASRPTAAGANQGFYFWASDVNGGTLYQNQSGSSWVPLTVGLTDSRLSDQRVPTDGSVTQAKLAAGAYLGIAATIQLFGTLAARPTASAANLDFYYYATDTGTLYQNQSGAAWATISGTVSAGSVTGDKLGPGAAAGGASTGSVGNAGTALPTTGLYNGYRFTWFSGLTVYDLVWRADLDSTYPWFVVGSTDLISFASASISADGWVNVAAVTAIRAGLYIARAELHGSGNGGGGADGRLVVGGSVVETGTGLGNATQYGIEYPTGAIAASTTLIVQGQGVNGFTYSYNASLTLRPLRVQ